MRRCVPLHRRAAAIAAEAHARYVLLEGIAHLIGRNSDLMHADLVAVIKRRRSAQGQQQHCCDPHLLMPDPACDPGTIVIAEHPVRPSTRRKRLLVVGDDSFDRTRTPQCRQQREIERHLRAGKVVAVIGDEAVQRKINFSDQDARLKLFSHAAHLGDDLMHLRLVGRILHHDLFVRRSALAKMRIRRVIAEFGVLDQMPDDVNAKPVDAPAQPKSHHIIDRLAHLRVTPVQVRLLGEERVIIILTRCGLVLPSAAAKFRQPVVGQPAVRSAIAPDIPVALWIIARSSRFDKPWVLIRSVVRHKIEDQLEAAFMGRVHQRIEIGHRTEHRVDAGVIGDVIAEIRHRRRKDRRQPDGVDPQRLQIRQSLDDPPDITDPVRIGVLE